jgi:hypothetical protein
MSYRLNMVFVLWPLISFAFFGDPRPDQVADGCAAQIVNQRRRDTGVPAHETAAVDMNVDGLAT